MSIKKLLILTAASLAAVGSTAVLAGGPDDMGPAGDSFHQSFYVHLNAGYAFQDWTNFVNNDANAWRAISKNRKGGFTGGADVGMNVIKHMGLELGGYYLPRLKGTQNTANPGSIPTGTTTGASKTNYMVYLAGKFDMPVFGMKGLDLYTKLGVMFRGMNGKGFTDGTAGYGATTHYWDYMYAFGFDYTTDALAGFDLDLQWMHLPANLRATSATTAAGIKKTGRRMPATNMLTIGAGYSFG